MPERVECDLTHHTLSVMDIGRLMTLDRIPVIAGDSFEFNSQFLFRLSQLRRPLAIDVKMDIFVFFCPYRFTYGQTWIDYIEKGGKEAVTFPSVTKTFNQNWLQVQSNTCPKHVFADAVNIYNQHFRDPGSAELNADTWVPDRPTSHFGLEVFHLKAWGTAQAYKANLADPEYSHNIANDKITVFDIQAVQSKSRNQSFRTFIASRYREIMEAMSDAEMNNYADNVPELVWRESAWMSGYDINGTAGPTFGATVGKGIGTLNLNMPRRFFGEHGTLWVMALLRMPPVFESARQYLDTFNRPYEYLVPQEGTALAPVELSLADLFEGGSGATKVGYVPAWEWYRDHPSYVHPFFFSQDTGWQTLNRPTSWAASARIASGQYDQMFGSLKQRHAQVACQHNVRAWRPLPDPMASIMGSI